MTDHYSSTTEPPDGGSSPGVPPGAPPAPRRLEQWFERVVLGQAPGVLAGAVRCVLAGLSVPYSLVIEIYKLLFRLAVLKTVRLPCRVVSVGNITMGGVGKTVAVEALAHALQDAGYRCVIVSYGFRAAASETFSVVSTENGVLLDAQDAGDEAAMLARSLPGIPVVIGRRRAVAGRAAVARFKPDVILLDDGFQHWRLHRDVDLVLLDSKAPLGNGRVFPAGLLRERPQSLRRAAACLLTRCDRASAQELENARKRVQANAPGRPVLETRHVLGEPYRAAAGAGAGNPAAVDQPWAVVAGIGQNRSFTDALRARGIPAAVELFYPDHHRYSPADVALIQERAASCSRVITTAKDAVKLVPLWTGPLPLWVAPVRMEGISPAQWLELCGLPQRPSD